MTGSVRVYCAETSPRGFLHHAVRAFSLPADLWRHRGLLRRFAGRELRSRFHGSYLGALWVLAQPLFQFAVYFVVFGLMFGRGGGLGEGDGWLFALWLFSGIVLFGVMRDATSSAMNSIVSNASLVKKVAFPAQLLPVVPVIVESTVSLVGVALVLLVGLLTGTAVLGWELLALPWLLAVVVVFATGLGMLLANLNVFARDVRQIYALFTMAWFFMTPNFWWPAMIEQQAPGVLEIVRWNPAYPMLIAARQVFGLAGDVGPLRPLVENLAAGSAWAVALLLAGYGTFMMHKHRYADMV